MSMSNVGRYEPGRYRSAAQYSDHKGGTTVHYTRTTVDVPQDSTGSEGRKEGEMDEESVGRWSSIITCHRHE